MDVLFLAHQADRTGAPIVLLTFLRWLKAHTGLTFGVVLKRGGELAAEFAALAPTALWPDVAPGWRSRLRRAARLDFRRRLGLRGVKLVWANTADTGDLLAALDPRCPVVTHVHELDWVLRHWVGPEAFATVRRHTTCYVAVSDAVRANLVRHGVPADRVRRVYEFIATRRFATIDPAAARTWLRARLGLPADAVIVGAAGEFHWRKGTDLFIQLAAAACRRWPEAPVHFVWLGGATDGAQYAGHCHDVGQAGIGHRVHFLGKQSEPEQFLAGMDVFVLPSREDPFPLVVLEAACAGKPVVCFAGSGGAPEFVEDDCGFVVPYLDVEGMAGRVLELAEAPALRQRLGACGAAKVRERFDVDALAPRLFDVIREHLA